MTTINNSGDLVWRIYRVGIDHRYCIAAFFTQFDAELFYDEHIRALGLENKYQMEYYRHENQVYNRSTVSV